MRKIGIKGMSCSHCASAVKKALEEIEGVRNVSVNLETSSAVFDEDRPVPVELLREKIEKAGYEIE